MVEKYYFAIGVSEIEIYERKYQPGAKIQFPTVIQSILPEKINQKGAGERRVGVKKTEINAAENIFLTLKNLTTTKTKILFMGRTKIALYTYECFIIKIR